MRALRVVAASVVIAAFSALGATSAQAEAKTRLRVGAVVGLPGWQW